MVTVYVLLGILFALVIALLIMFKINNDYVKDCDAKWNETIKLCKDVCKMNEDMLNLRREEEE